MCSSCGLCSGPPCIIYEHNSAGDPCPECNPDSVGHDYSRGGGATTSGGLCPLLILAGAGYITLVGALAFDVLLS